MTDNSSSRFNFHNENYTAHNTVRRRQFPPKLGRVVGTWLSLPTPPFPFPVAEMTYTVSSGTLHSTIPYHRLSFPLLCRNFSFYFVSVFWMGRLKRRERKTRHRRKCKGGKRENGKRGTNVQWWKRRENVYIVLIFS